MPDKYFIYATSPLGVKIHTTKPYWNFIAQKKHPEVLGKGKKAVATIEKPDIIKRTASDAKIFVYYRKTRNKYFCIVSRQVGKEGFIITAYITRKFVKGEIIWQKAGK